MPGFLLFSVPVIALALALGLALSGRLRAARAGARQPRDLARRLHQLAGELETSGLALQGLAGSPAGVVAEAQHLLALSDAIGEVLAAGGSPRRITSAEVPLSPLIEEAVAAFLPLPGARHWRIAGDFGPLTVLADRRALLGALRPVLGRAARMTRPGECIDLRPVLTPDALAIVVEDEGAGLPAADLAVGAPDGTRGMAFGLATARDLMEAHGGSLRLEALPGVGARAWLTLPRARVLAAAPG